MKYILYFIYLYFRILRVLQPEAKVDTIYHGQYPWPSDGLPERHSQE